MSETIQYVDNTYRRTFSTEDSVARAARLAAEGLDVDGKRLKKKIILGDKSALTARTDDLRLDEAIGKSTLVTANTSKNEQGGFYCELCDVLLKDSSAYLDHCNGRKHVTLSGQSMRAVRATAATVKRKLAETHEKKEKADEKVSSAKLSWEERLRRQQEQDAEQKRLKIERKKAKKAAEKVVDEEETGIDPELAAQMGFSGFK